MNKADYIALINARLPDGGEIPSSDHRATMHTNADSIGELVYGDELSDSQADETYTVANANFNYSITLYKVGSNITITGNVFVLNSVNRFSTIFGIDDADFEVIDNIAFHCIAYSTNGNQVPFYIFQNGLLTRASLVSGETYSFTINYKSKN